MTASLRHALAAAVLAVLASGTSASAQLSSNQASATLTAVLAESLSITLLPPLTTFTLTSGSATNTAVLPLTATTSWTLALTRTDITLYGYFLDASAALSHTLITNTADIPSARVEVSVNGGALAAFDQTMPFGAASAGRQLWTQSISLLSATGLRSDTLVLNINLNGYALPADVYTGTLRLRAQATP